MRLYPPTDSPKLPPTPSAKVSEKSLDHGKLFGHVEGEVVVLEVFHAAGQLLSGFGNQVVLTFLKTELLDALDNPGAEDLPDLQEIMQLPRVDRLNRNAAIKKRPAPLHPRSRAVSFCTMTFS